MKSRKIRQTTATPAAGEQALAELGQVMSELAHDLSNEMVVLQGWAVLARGELDAGRLPSGEVDQVLEIATAAGDMLRDLIATVAGQALSPEVSFDPIAVTEAVVGRRVRSIAGRDVHLTAEIPCDLRVRGLASFWSRLVANLLHNAARHARGRIDVRLVRDDESLVVRVEDDGAGVAPRDRSAIFDPFWSADDGVGLGLSSTRWLARQLGGEVEYRTDTVLGGAAFEVRIPADRLISDRAPSTGAATLSGLRLLVIEDDRLVRRSLVRLMARAGVDARELDPTGEAVEALLDAVLAALPDAILLDLHLGRRTGIQLWDRIRDELPALATRAVFMSGSGPGDEGWEAAATTGQPVLAKPFSLEQLADALARLPRRPS